MMGAAILETPELVLDESETKALADAAARVAAHYDHTMDPKTLAWVNLAMVAGGIYGTRFFAIRERQRASAGTDRGKVLNMKPGPAGPNGKPAGPPAAAAQTPAELFGIHYNAQTGD